MIRNGDRVYLDLRTNRLYSRRSKNRILFGIASEQNNQNLEEGCKINYPSRALTDPRGFGIPPKDKEYDFKIKLY